MFFVVYSVLFPTVEKLLKKIDQVTNKVAPFYVTLCWFVASLTATAVILRSAVAI